MTTALDIITDSLREIGVLAASETPTDADAQAALRSMNRMIDRWNASRLMIYVVSRQQFSFTAGQQSYTMGSGANFNAARPAKIDHAEIRVLTQTPNYDIPLEIVTDQQWSAITDKNETEEIPRRLWVQYGFPNLTLNFWPKPSVVNAVGLYTWSALSSFAALTTSVSLPPGYEDALVYGLASRLAPQFGLQVNPKTLADEGAALDTIRRFNLPKPRTVSDLTLLAIGGQRSFDWRTGE